MAVLKLKLMSLTVASTLLATTPAIADVKTQTVRHTDLDLSSDAGRHSLEMRVKQAVKQVCRSPRAHTLEDRQDQKNCEEAAYHRAAPETARIIAAYMDKRRLAFRATARAGIN
jgi:UrcA family protein